jgi:hypothetical protein
MAPDSSVSQAINLPVLMLSVLLILAGPSGLQIEASIKDEAAEITATLT